MPPAFLGKGWRFPILPDKAGCLGYVDGDTNVEQSVQILLMTALGERVMRSDFGTQTPRLVFSPGSLQYLKLIENTIADAIKNWEPRIDLVSALAEADPADESKITVSVIYTVRQTNTRTNLVFPFYVGTTQVTA